mmetsp:Transcript_21087/g.63441  ORF Transcript_21087/g.63441 Transcript_21087/m.63441 type:complete len:206 (-) Transcript_21087:1965-2582(-)
MDKVKQWFMAKVVEPGKSYITSGAEPKQLALSAAVGWCCGLCPLLGVSAGLCCLAILLARGRLHGPMTLLANLVSVPAELTLIVVYMRIGEIITGAPHQDFDRISLSDLWGPSGKDLLKAAGRAVLAWALTWPLLVGVLYIALTPCFAWLQARYLQSRGAAEPGSPTTILDGSQPLIPGDASTDGSVGGEVGLTSRRSGSDLKEW